MKKGWAGTFAVLVLGATVLTGCGSTSDSGHIKLKIATVGNEKHQSTMAAAAFQEKLEELEQLVIDARFECTGPYARLTTTEYAATLNKMLGLIRSIDEVNES